MGKRATRIASCVLAGVMAMQMTGCGKKKVDYTLDGESGSASDTVMMAVTMRVAALQRVWESRRSVMRHLMWAIRACQR